MSYCVSKGAKTVSKWLGYGCGERQRYACMISPRLPFSLMMSGRWTLWAEGRAVDNGFIVIHGQRPGSPAGFAGELSTSPPSFVGEARGCCANRWCFRLPSETVKEPGWRGKDMHLPSGQTLEELPHPHRPSVDEESSGTEPQACDRRFDRKLTPVCSTPATLSVITGETPCKPYP